MAEEPKAAESSDLYDILDGCNDEELAPIVELLVGSNASVLGITRAYERHQPRHARYADRIADEIYRLALEALPLEDRSRPSYGAMIEGLCRKIGIPARSDDVATNERLLFDVFASRHLGAVPPNDRPKVVDNTCLAISKAVGGLFTNPVWPPFAAAMLRVGLLRRRIQDEEAQIRGDDLLQSDDSTLPSVDQEGALIVHDEGGIPVLTLARLPGRGLDWTELASDGRVAGALVPLLKAIEPFVSADKLLANGNYVRVGIKGGAAALSRSKAGGHLVGSALGHQGQVPFYAIAAGGVAWPAAVLVLAIAYMEQRRFQNIERSLDGIRVALRDVARFQREERRSVLTGSIRYFQQVSRAVLAGELDQEVLQEIERHEADLVRVQDHLFSDVDSQLGTMRTLKNESWGSSKFVKALGEQQTTLERLVDEAAMCIRARSCGYQLLCAFPDRDARKRARFDDLTVSLGRLCPDGDVGNAMDQVLREKLEGISSVETKALLLGRQGNLFDGLKAFRKEASRAMTASRQSHHDLPAILSFDLRIENGVPVAIAAA